MPETNKHEDEFILEASDAGASATPETPDDADQNELLSLYDDIIGAKEEKEKVGIYTEWAKTYLERNFGVTDLSDIEGVHLRNTVEQLLPKVEQEQKMVLEGKMEAMNFAEMEEEAPALWLYNLYGIHPKDIPHVFVVKDDTTGQAQTFEITMEDRARELAADLQAQGHRAYIMQKIPQDFKDYLKHIRQEAHKP
jgi:hypothetical protein